MHTEVTQCLVYECVSWVQDEPRAGGEEDSCCGWSLSGRCCRLVGGGGHNILTVQMYYMHIVLTCIIVKLFVVFNTCIDIMQLNHC